MPPFGFQQLIQFLQQQMQQGGGGGHGGMSDPNYRQQFTHKGMPIITGENWMPGMPTSGKGVRLGQGSARDNPALQQQLLANFQNAGSQPNVGGVNAQYSMYDTNPAMWGNWFNKQTGVNPGWINANAYDPGHQYMNESNFQLTPGQGGFGASGSRQNQGGQVQPGSWLQNMWQPMQRQFGSGGGATPWAGQWPGHMFTGGTPNFNESSGTQVSGS